MIKSLKNQGLNISEIANALNLDRKTVSNNLRKDKTPKYIRSKVYSKLDGFKDYVDKRLEKYNISSLKLYEEIQKQGFKGKYGIVNSYVKSVKKKLKNDAVIRFETMPGEQAQVDWGYCGKIFDCVKRKWIKINCFVMVLGYSRMRYIEFFEDQKIESFLQGHNNAFKYFNGYTREVLYDNLKSVVIKRLMRAKDSVFNKKFMDYAGYYGFQPILARPYKPNTKGKVENTVKYVKQNFLSGEEFNSLNEINQKAKIWLEKVNNKIHATTKEVPFIRLKKEGLLSIQNKQLYDLTPTYYRIVQKDCHFSFRANFYSVPYKYAGKEVNIKLIDNIIYVKYRNILIASHNLNIKDRYKYITKEEDIKELREIRIKNKAKIRKYKKEESIKLMLKMNNHYIDDVEKRDLRTYEGVLI